MVVWELASPVDTFTSPPVLPEAELLPVLVSEVTVVSTLASLFWVTVVFDESLVVTELVEPEPLSLITILTSADAGFGSITDIPSIKAVATRVSTRLARVSICM